MWVVPRFLRETPYSLSREGCPKVHRAVRGGIRNEHRFKVIGSRREIWFLL